MRQANSLLCCLLTMAARVPQCAVATRLRRSLLLWRWVWAQRKQKYLPPAWSFDHRVLGTACFSYPCLHD